MDDDLSTLLDELSSFSMPALNTQKVPIGEIKLEKGDAEQYFLDKTKAIIEAGVGAIQDLTCSVVQGGDSREVEALSKLLQSTAGALDVLNKNALIDKKADRDEQLEIQGKKEIAQLKGPSQKNITNNVLITSREEMMKKITKGETAELFKLQDK
jgi:hypothetical protein